MNPAAPRVLISYSHDSPEHEARVLDVADRLRDDGVDAVIDRYEPDPPEGWPPWMERQIREANFVPLVCTETYARRVNGEEAPGVGRGVCWEANLIRNELYNARTVSGKFIPVLFAGADEQFIPAPLQGHTHYRLDGDEGYEALYRRLTGQPLTPKRDLGARKPLPPRRPGGASGVGAAESPAGGGSGAPAGSEGPAGAPRSEKPPVDRNALYGRLRALPPGLLGQLLFALEVPPGVVRSGAAPQGERVEDLLNWAASPDGRGLEAVAQELEQVLGRP